MIKKMNFEDIEKIFAREGVTRQVFSGDSMMMVINTIEPYANPALHQHSQEQITYILSGDCDFTLGDEKVHMGPGDVIKVPPDVPHTLTPTGEEAIINIDVFCPIREDYL